MRTLGHHTFHTFILLTSILAALAIALLGLTAPAVAQSSGEPIERTTYENLIRLSGQSSVEAAIAFSELTFPEGSDVALLGRSDLFPDSLSGGVAQGAAAAPLLLTDRSALSPATDAELQRLGAQRVVILGGTAAVSAEVEQILADRGYTTQRVDGITRIETAIAVTETYAPTATTALLARAYGPADDPTAAFADALAGGAWAAAEGVPLLLTQTEVLTGSTRDHLASSAITDVVVLGGTAAVSDAVVAELEGMGISVTRAAGGNRFQTAVAIAEARGLGDAQAAERLILVEGTQDNSWSSGFAAASHADAFDAPVLLAAQESVPQATLDALATNRSGDNTLVCGPLLTAVVCDTAAEQVGLVQLVTLVVDDPTVEVGGDVTGSVTGDAVESVTVSGCGLDEVVVEVAADGSFTIPLPEDLPPGSCTLTFEITYTDGTTDTIEVPILVVEPGEEPEAGPTMTDARLTSAVSPTTVDLGDEWALTFSEAMDDTLATDAVMQLVDPDGDTVGLTCNADLVGTVPLGATCVLGEEGTELVVTLDAGSTAGGGAGDAIANYPLEFISIDPADTPDGRALDLGASEDIVVDDES